MGPLSHWKSAQGKVRTINYVRLPILLDLVFFHEVSYYINKDNDKDPHLPSGATHVYKLTLLQHECDIYRNEEGSTLVVTQKELA
jgi:hypothetical protein